MEKKTDSVPVPAPELTVRKGRKPWEITIEEAEEEGRRLRARHQAADRIAAPLFAQQLAETDDSEN
jgi:hypothetical protein